MARVSIGWVARQKLPGRDGKPRFGGWNAKCKVYGSRALARAAVGGGQPHDVTEAQWDFFEVFIEEQNQEQVS